MSFRRVVVIERDGHAEVDFIAGEAKEAVLRRRGGDDGQEEEDGMK